MYVAELVDAQGFLIRLNKKYGVDHTLEQMGEYAGLTHLQVRVLPTPQLLTIWLIVENPNNMPR